MPVTTTSRQLLAREARRVLHEGAVVVEGLDDRLFTRVDERVAHSSIGAHVRHCVDHVQCFLVGYASGRVDYDARERDEAVELDRALAAARLRASGEALVSAASADRTEEMLVRMDGDDLGWCRSTLERELQGLVSHTVHHFALIAFLVRAAGHPTDASFGVAQSTLAYWRATGRTAEAATP